MKLREVCPRKEFGFKSGEGLDYCIAAHAEVNAIVQAARMGVSVKGATLVVYGIAPCHNCMSYILNSGVSDLLVCAEGKIDYDNISSKMIESQKEMSYCYFSVGDGLKSNKIQYWFDLARSISMQSKCLSRKVGAILLRDNCIISTGYNGPSRGIVHCSERKWGLPNNKNEGDNNE